MNKSELGLTIGLGMPQKPRVQRKRSKVKRKKLSNYEKYRRKLKQRLNYWRKKGYELPDVEIPPTEKQLREQGIKGQELAKQTRKLKDTLKKFKNQRYVSRSSGEVFQGRKEIDEAMKYVEELIAYDSFAKKFEELLLRDIPYSNNRLPDEVELSRYYQKSLLYYFRQVVEDKGERAVGRRIAETDDAFLTLDLMMYGSYEIIYPSYDKLVKLFQSVTGRVLTQQEIEELEEDANNYIFDFDY